MASYPEYINIFSGSRFCFSSTPPPPGTPSSRSRISKTTSQKGKKRQTEKKFTLPPPPPAHQTFCTRNRVYFRKNEKEWTRGHPPGPRVGARVKQNINKNKTDITETRRDNKSPAFWVAFFLLTYGYTAPLSPHKPPKIFFCPNFSNFLRQLQRKSGTKIWSGVRSSRNFWPVRWRWSTSDGEKVI